jgi:2-keto-4-pentenoate hydratase/2-oxohepta-3-ene-1,7-dioic acid hydratase in catechol pathway
MMTRADLGAGATGVRAGLARFVVSPAPMKLFRFGPAGEELPGVIGQSGAALDVSAFGEDFDEAFFTNDGLNRLRAWLDHNERRCPTVDPKVRRGAIIKRPSKVICVGMNYAAHAREQNQDPPKEPVLFMKATTSVCGPDDDLLLPRGSVKTDWEVELGVVIGKRAKYVEKARWKDYVAGYAVINDYSEREYQMERGGQWDKGKGCDTFAPIGPWLVTADEIADPGKLNLWLKVNVPTLVSYISQFMTLLPGDIISTGTPSGVGCFMKPPRFLKAGDVVELGIEGLGTSKQRVVAEQ